MNFAEIIERIKKIKGIHDDHEVASLLGFTKSAFSERKRRNSIPRDRLEVFCERENINIDWLLTGEGLTYRQKAEKPLRVAEEPAIYNEIVKLEERINELKKAVKGESPGIELTDDEIQWLRILRRAKEQLPPEKLEILMDGIEAILKIQGLLPKEEKLWVRKTA